MKHSATYSPEDNKLRLYPACRLPKDDYEKIKAAGFSWAPKQELFVAPMWTPTREDLLLEWCEEIDDEDTSLVDRATERADRFTEYSGNRAADAERAREAVSAIADNIPLGQPILVGHHSEKRARKDAEKIENGMRRSVKMWRQSQYWKERAAGAIRSAKYKERPAVRARRIKTLEADKRKQERYKADAEKFLRAWGREGLTFEQAKTISNYDHVSRCLPLSEFPRTPPASQYEGAMSLWSALDSGVINHEQARKVAIPVHENMIRHAGRWIEHIENRLEYERAMLADSGGTASDRTGPEKGGACRCWATDRVRGAWSKIVKVNKVSVSVLDNWGNGGPDFTRTIPFDKLIAVMSAAEVQAARDAGKVITENDRTILISEDAPPPKPTETKKEDDQNQFRQMEEAIREGIAVEIVTAPDLFPTPAELAAKMVEIAEIDGDHRVLEPSAGTGVLLRAIGNTPDKVAVEINSKLVVKLMCCGVSGLHIHEGDFLEMSPEQLGTFDRILMNPPFSGGADLKHIRHAIGFLKPGGKLVALCANGPRQQEEYKNRIASYWEDLPRGTFKEQGTNVNVALMVITGKENKTTRND